ncbi:MAG: hypothetical protein ABR954_01795 [Dehalococcoidales bacterium]
MKKVLLIIFTCLCLVATGCASIATAQQAAGDNPQKSDFNFIFKYGVSGGNTLDTFHGTYTRDMILDPAITIDMVLTAAEMDSIYQKMLEIDFFNYPDKFSVDVADNETKIEVTPYPTYFFKVEYSGKTKELLWHDKYVNSDAQANKLKELINLVKSIIESKAEYQALPEASGGYL